MTPVPDRVAVDGDGDIWGCYDGTWYCIAVRGTEGLRATAGRNPEHHAPVTYYEPKREDSDHG